MRRIENCFWLDNMQDDYVALVKAVLNGDESSPRGMRTRELLDVQIQLSDPTLAVPVGVGRKLSMKLGFSEVTQLISGVSDAVQIVNAAKNYGAFVENGRLYGAYGPRTYGQFSNVIRRLMSDSDTRQAGVVVWKPYDLSVPSKDIPCTLTLQYFLRNGKLNARTTMRSNDIFWGVPYDFWMFTATQRTLAYALGVDVGTYTHVIGSLHAYVDRDTVGFEALHQYDGSPQPHPPFSLFNLTRVRSDQDPISRWFNTANILEGVLGLRRKWDDSSHWARQFSQTLNETQSTGLLCPNCRYVLPRTDEFFSKSKLDRCTELSVQCVCRSCQRGAQYGISGHQFEALRIVQSDKCAGCGKTDSESGGRWPRLHVDHDHTTGAVRGLLCGTCNYAVGAVYDSSSNLRNLASYLDDPPFKRVIN